MTSQLVSKPSSKALKDYDDFESGTSDDDIAVPPHTGGRPSALRTNSTLDDEPRLMSNASFGAFSPGSPFRRGLSVRRRPEDNQSSMGLTTQLSMTSRQMSMSLSFVGRKKFGDPLLSPTGLTSPPMGPVSNGSLFSPGGSTPGAAKASSFSHRLTQQLGPDYFHLIDPGRDTAESVGEVDVVCDDIRACCSELERLGLNPAHDTLNGVMQTMLQEPIRFMAKPQAWDTMKLCRDKCMREYVEVVYQVISGGRASLGTTASGSQPLADMQVVGGSWLIPSRALMVHVWTQCDAARSFLSGWVRVWQSIFECRIEGIRAPVTIMYAIEGQYVSVTALPPALQIRMDPIVAPGPACGPVMSHYAEHLIAALALPPDVTALTLFHAADGGFYLLSLAEVLGNRLAAFPKACVRMELLRKASQEPAFSLDEYLTVRAIPRVIDELCKAMEKRDDNSAERLVRDRMLPRAMHREGVNLACMYAVLCAVRELPPDSPHRTPLEGACKAEMVSRAFKDLVRIDLNFGAGVNSDVEGGRCHVVNRLCRLLISSVEFWGDHLNPRIRAKFGCPRDFSVEPGGSNPSASLKAIANRVGAEYNPFEGRFTAFAAVAAVWITMFDAHSVAIQASSKDELEDAVMKLWATVATEGVPARRHVRRCRAAMMSLLTKQGITEVDNVWELLSGEQTPVALHFSTFALELKLARKNYDFVDTHNKLLQIATHPVDAGIASTRLLQVFNLLQGTDGYDPGSGIEAVETICALPWVDFTFSGRHTQALRDIEAGAGMATAEQLERLIAVASLVATQLWDRGRQFNSGRYLSRVLLSLVGVPLAEASAGAGRLAATCYASTVASLGRDDGRASLACLVLALFSLTALGSSVGPGAEKIVAKLRLATKKMSGRSTQMMARLGRGNTALQLLTRAATLLESAGDRVAATSVMSHVHHCGRAFLAALLLQRCGRGFMQRCGSHKQPYLEKAETLEKSLALSFRWGSWLRSPEMSKRGSTMNALKSPKGGRVLSSQDEEGEVSGTEGSPDGSPEGSPDGSRRSESSSPRKKRDDGTDETGGARYKKVWRPEEMDNEDI